MEINEVVRLGYWPRKGKLHYNEEISFHGWNTVFISPSPVQLAY